jgi:hypothetical protein
MKKPTGLFISSSIVLVLSFLSPLLISNCDRAMEQDYTIQLYKPKSDYSSYVPIELSADKKVITSLTGAKEPCSMQLDKGYFINGTMGVNTAYLSLTFEEYSPQMGIDSFYKYVMEVDPFIEYYTSEDISLRNFEEESNGIDTALINGLIREDRITDYFVRLK